MSTFGKYFAIIGLVAISGRVTRCQSLPGSVQVSFTNNFYDAVQRTTSGHFRYAIFQFGTNYGAIEATTTAPQDEEYDNFVAALTDSVGSIPCTFGLYNVRENSSSGPFIFLSWFSPESGPEVGNCAMRNGAVHNEIRTLIPGVHDLTAANAAQLEWNYVSNGI